MSTNVAWTVTKSINQVFSLNLHESELDLHIDEVLTSFFKFNVNLRAISFREIISKSFSRLISLLSTCNTDRFECIEVTSMEGTDDQAATFFNALNRHRKLIELAFVGPHIGRIGCLGLANLLTNPTSKIIKLRLGANDFDDYSITVLSNALMYKNTLISLNFAGKLDEPTRITNSGWHVFFAIFARPSCSIEDLFLHHFPLGDEFVTHLGNALAINQTLKYLHIGMSISFRVVGWKSLASCLNNPNSALEELNLLGCGIDSGGVAAILTGLAGNSTLKRLNIEYADIIESVEVLSHFLCDKTSIGSTYLSNHTMNSLHLPHYRDPVPAVSSYLKMNRNRNKFEVARRKILAHHFSGEIAASCVLSRMPETAFPHALSCIGIDDFGYSTMYNIVHAFPPLFISPKRARKKRKC